MKGVKKMREIKFRAWDKEQKCFIDIGENALVGVWHSENNTFNLDYYSDIIIVEQFTGLYDKNGTEIYEGDILDSITRRSLIVVWSSHQAGFDLMFRNDAPIALFKNYAEKSIVLGNIHENPELLK